MWWCNVKFNYSLSFYMGQPVHTMNTFRNLQLKSQLIRDWNQNLKLIIPFKKHLWGVRYPCNLELLRFRFSCQLSFSVELKVQSNFPVLRNNASNNECNYLSVIDNCTSLYNYITVFKQMFIISLYYFYLGALCATVRDSAIAYGKRMFLDWTSLRNLPTLPSLLP